MLREPSGGSAPLCESRIKRLVAEAQAGDRDAMRGLYVALAPAVQAHVARIVGGHDAEDVTQQVFTKLLVELARYRPGEAPFSAWLLRVARNQAVDHVRRNRALPCAEPRAAAPAADAAPQRAAVLLEALGELPRAQRDVLLLRHLVGLSPFEIADRLGRSVRSVYCLHNRGAAAARVALGRVGVAPATHRPGAREPEWPAETRLIAA